MATETEYREWLVYQLALEGALQISQLLREEQATEGIRTALVRESRRVCFAVVQVWFERGRLAKCVAGLRRVMGMVAAVQVWLELAITAGAIPAADGEQVYGLYGELLEELEEWRRLAAEWKVPLGGAAIQSIGSDVAGGAGHG